LINSGTITGGNGGTGRAAGAGGVGVIGSGLTITNNGTIVGGTNGGGSVQANAITFTGGSNQLTLGSGSAISGSIEAAGTLTLRQDTDATLSNRLTGTGAVVKSGTGTLTLEGANTYTGGTTLSGGALAVGADSALGNSAGGLTFGGGTLQWTSAFDLSRSVTVNAAGGTFDTNGNDVTVSSIVSGSGGITKTGTGTLTLGGVNTYSGGTTFGGGTVSVSADSALGDAAGALTFTGGTLAWGAAFDLSRDVTLGSGDGVLDTNGFDVTASGTIDGTGGLIKAGTGTLTLTGTNSYTGGTTVSGGTLRGDAASLTGSIVNNGAVIFDQGGTGTYSGTLSGTGGVTKMGAGTLILTGSNSYTGGTTVSAGTLQGNSTSLTGTIVNNAAVVFDQGTDGTFSGVLSGTGSLRKTGAGALELTEVNTLTGNTTVSDGTLVVNGSLAESAVTLETGGTLGGGGTIGDLFASGTVAPGNSIGTLSTGDVLFRTGSTYHVEINANGTSDLLKVAGTATIQAGATVEVDPQPGSYGRKISYRIIQTTGGVDGSFDTVEYTVGNTLFHYLALETRGTDLVLWISRNPISFAETVDKSLTAVGAGVDKLETETPGTVVVEAERNALLQALYDLDDVEEINRAVALVSGAGAWHVGLGSRIGTAMVGAASGGVGTIRSGGAGLAGFAPTVASLSADMTQTALGERGSMGLLETVGRPIPVASKDVDPVLGLSGEEGSGTASKGPRLWVDSIGGFGERDADGYVPGQSHSYWGFVGGYRHPIGSDWEIGLASAYAASRVESDDGLAHKDGFSVLGLAQARWTPGPWAIEGGLGLARHVFDGERRVAFTGFDETATGRSTSWEGLAQLDVRRDWTTPWGVISPLGGVALSVTREEGWSEKGGGAANLVFEPETDIRAQSHLGLGYERTWDVGDDLMLRPSVGLLWVANLGQLESGQRARFADGATSWQVPSLAEDRHSGAARIELGLSSGAGWSLGLGYASRVAPGARDHAFRIGGALRF
jgi:autotransporter-associated beta strand protein